MTDEPLSASAFSILASARWALGAVTGTFLPLLSLAVKVFIVWRSYRILGSFRVGGVSPLRNLIKSRLCPTRKFPV